MFTILTLNDAAFARLLTYTGHDADSLIRAIPSLTPVSFPQAAAPPAIRVSSLPTRMLDCPECRLRRDGAFLDTRLFPLKMACLRHSYWLYRDGAGQHLGPAVLPEIATAQKRLTRLAARHGTISAVRAYSIANSYLNGAWRARPSPWWYTRLLERWYQRAQAHQTSWPPSWAMHPECTALAVMFASPHWAGLAVPAPDRRHRLFYQHMLTILGISDGQLTASIRNFDPLAEDIREQASRGHLLSDPDWGEPSPFPGPAMIPFTDITTGIDMTAETVRGSSVSETCRTPDALRNDD